LCLSIGHPSGSVKRGHPATFTVHVWINNWTPAGKVTVSLFTVTAGQQATFTSRGCHSSSSCTIPTPGSAPAELNAQVTTGHSATSVTIKAVGEASAATLSQPLAVTGSEQFIFTARTPHATPDPAPSLTGIEPDPLPALNNITSSTLMRPGNAAGLFPSIVPSTPAPATTTSAQPQPTRTLPPQAVQVLPLGLSTVTAQIIGVIALVLAVLLAALAKLLPSRRTKPSDRTK
jgi:hypothetical protein